MTTAPLRRHNGNSTTRTSDTNTVEATDPIILITLSTSSTPTMAVKTHQRRATIFEIYLIQSKICRFLTVRDIRRCTFVSRDFHTAFQPYLWRHLTLNRRSKINRLKTPIAQAALRQYAPFVETITTRFADAWILFYSDPNTLASSMSMTQINANGSVDNPRLQTGCTRNKVYGSSNSNNSGIGGKGNGKPNPYRIVFPNLRAIHSLDLVNRPNSKEANRRKMHLLLPLLDPEVVPKLQSLKVTHINFEDPFVFLETILRIERLVNYGFGNNKAMATTTTNKDKSVEKTKAIEDDDGNRDGNGGGKKTTQTTTAVSAWRDGATLQELYNKQADFNISCEGFRRTLEIIAGSVEVLFLGAMCQRVVDILDEKIVVGLQAVREGRQSDVQGGLPSASAPSALLLSSTEELNQPADRSIGYPWQSVVVAALSSIGSFYLGAPPLQTRQFASVSQIYCLRELDLGIMTLDDGTRSIFEFLQRCTYLERLTTPTFFPQNIERLIELTRTRWSYLRHLWLKAYCAQDGLLSRLLWVIGHQWRENRLHQRQEQGRKCRRRYKKAQEEGVLRVSGLGGEEEEGEEEEEEELSEASTGDENYDEVDENSDHYDEIHPITGERLQFSRGLETFKTTFSTSAYPLTVGVLLTCHSHTLVTLTIAGSKMFEGRALHRVLCVCRKLEVVEAMSRLDRDSYKWLEMTDTILEVENMRIPASAIVSEPTIAGINEAIETTGAVKAKETQAALQEGENAFADRSGKMEWPVEEWVCKKLRVLHLRYLDFDAAYDWIVGFPKELTTQLSKLHHLEDLRVGRVIKGGAPIVPRSMVILNIRLQAGVLGSEQEIKVMKESVSFLLQELGANVKGLKRLELRGLKSLIELQEIREVRKRAWKKMEWVQFS